MRAGIVDGTFPAQYRLTEQDVSELAGVSRTPVREALRRLHAEGLVKFVPNQGAFVASWTTADIEDVFALRAMLEAYAVERAVERSGPADLERLAALADAILAESEGKAPGYLGRIADLNLSFHRMLLDLAGSARLKAMFASLVELPLVFQTLRTYTEEDLRRSSLHHREIVMALKAGNGRWAASVMRSHLYAALDMFRTRQGLPYAAARTPGGIDAA